MSNDALSSAQADWVARMASKERQKAIVGRIRSRTGFSSAYNESARRARVYTRVRPGLRQREGARGGFFGPRFARTSCSQRGQRNAPQKTANEEEQRAAPRPARRCPL